MKINNYVLLKVENGNVGLFQKEIDMPCLPPIGCTTTFGKGIKKISCNISSIDFSESEGKFSLTYIIDLDDRRAKHRDHIGIDHYPMLLVNECGFTVCWLEEAYQSIFKKLHI